MNEHQKPPVLEILLPGGSEPAYTTTREGARIVFKAPDGSYVHIDTGTFDWHRLFHIALGHLTEERLAS